MHRDLQVNVLPRGHVDLWLDLQAQLQGGGASRPTPALVVGIENLRQYDGIHTFCGRACQGSLRRAWRHQIQ